MRAGGGGLGMKSWKIFHFTSALLGAGALRVRFDGSGGSWTVISGSIALKKLNDAFGPNLARVSSVSLLLVGIARVLVVILVGCLWG